MRKTIQDESRARNERKRCAEIARAYLAGAAFRVEGYRDYVEYFSKKYDIKRSVINSSKNVGLLFIKRDSDDFPSLSGDTWLKEEYHLEEDLPITILTQLLPIYHGIESEKRVLDRAFKEHKINAQTKISEVREIVNKIRETPKRNLGYQRNRKSEYEIFQEWPEDVKKNIFWMEFERNYSSVVKEIKKRLFKK